MAQPARPRGRPAATTNPSGRDRLLAAARTEFARDGLSGTSVERLTRAADIAAPTLYHHFGNKTGLFVAVAEDVYTQVIVHFEAAVRPDTPFSDAVDAILRSSVPIMGADPSLSAMIAVTQTELRRDPSLATPLRPIMRRFREFFDGIAARAPRDRYPDDASRRHLALALITIITGLNAQAPLMHRPDDFESTVDAMRQLIVGAGPSRIDVGQPVDRSGK